MADDDEAPPTPLWWSNIDASTPGPFNEEGLPHGKGVMKYPAPPAGEDEEGEEKPGDVFEGIMVNGKRDGRGKYTWSSGAVFEGVYVEGKKHGKGKLTLPDKSVYEGRYCELHLEGRDHQWHACTGSEDHTFIALYGSKLGLFSPSRKLHSRPDRGIRAVCLQQWGHLRGGIQGW